VRVLHVQKVKGVGGTERHLLSLLPGLRDAGIEVRMWAATTEDGYRFVEALRGHSVEVVDLQAGPDLNPILLRSLWAEIDRFNPSIVHTHLVHGDVYGQLVARMRDIPGISSFHSVHGFFRREPVRSAERVAGRFAQHTIAISQHVRDFLIDARLRSPGRIRVIPYGIDAAGWRLSIEARVAARARFGLGDRDIAVGIASRLIPGKGHDLLLSAFRSAQTDATDLRLLIAGDGALRPKIERMSEGLDAGMVRTLGFVADIRAFMGACDIIVFPTLPVLGEGFGLAVLEAMAAERPVVATKVASLGEIVADGETGILVSPSDPGQLASALARLGMDARLRKQMGIAGHRRAKEVFGLEQMIAETRSLYRESTKSAADHKRSKTSARES
jgi:glycosyltransferase involved in cell wall biosynthesis